MTLHYAAVPPVFDAGELACPECDLLLPHPQLQPGQRASCPRCGYGLSSRPHDALQRSLAFAIAGVVFLAVANAFPFLAMEASGLHSEMTLPATAAELYRNDSKTLAALVLGFIVVAPAVMLGAIIVLLAPLVRDVGAPWLVATARLIFGLGPWNMVEVFLIGVIVSLVKLGGMADVVLGLSFWSYAAFTICLTASLASLDRLLVWDEIERLGAR